MTTKKSIQETTNQTTLTEKELELLRGISQETLADLEEKPFSTWVRELMVRYSRELDLGGDANWLAKEVIRQELVGVETLQKLSLNSLSLIRVVYLDGIEGADKLLKEFSMRGLWEAIRERRELLVSTLSKVDNQMELREKQFTEGLSSEQLSLQVDDTIIQEFTPEKIRGLIQGTQLTFDDLYTAIYVLRDLGETVGYTKEGTLYLQTLLEEEYLTPEGLVKRAREEYKAAEEDTSYLE